MSRARLGALAALLALGLTGCGISAGNVVGKAYQPASTYSCQTGSVPVGSSVTVPIYGTCTDPACYRLDLFDGEDSGSVCVTEREWTEVRGGEWFPRAG